MVWYVRTLEEVMIRATADFGVTAFRIPGKTGIWVTTEYAETPGPAEEKLACHRRAHQPLGDFARFAYNVSTDLRYFDLIVPCGIAGRKATSLEKLLGRNVTLMEVVRPQMAQHFGEVFGLEPMKPRDVLC